MIKNSNSSKVINSKAKNNKKLQTYKKSVINKAAKEIDKIEEEIKRLEQK